jgi:MraZ protein
VEAEAKVSVADAPRGTRSAKCDDKGRLKLPAEFHQYLKELGETKLFVTTLDERTVRLYPIPRWKQTEKILETETLNPEGAEALTFLANYYGEDVDLDDQGRVLIPKLLRQELGIEGQTVYMLWVKGTIEVHSEGNVKQMLQSSRTRAAEALGPLKGRGV